jgi:hypothetical protein
MRILASTAAALVLLAAATPTAFADTPPAPVEPPSPAFERIKSLAGEWAGTADGSADMKGLLVKASIRVISNGSAVMITTGPGTPYEMVTIIHRDDGGVLVATHYCAGMNQPRMKAKPGPDLSRITFDFVDGTNLAAHPGRMQRLVIVTPGPDRHVQEWTSRDGGKEATDTFDLTRVR